MSSEIWKIIDGFPDYKISSWGRVLSTRTQKAKILKGWKVANIKWSNYRHSYDLYPVSGNKITRAAHVLVMEAFGIPKSNKNMCIKHINGDYYDNGISNLCWINRRDRHKNFDK